MDPICAVCPAKAPHRCASCSLVSYCSVEHQKEHWKIHKKNCTYVKIVVEPGLGKRLVATRDVKPGTVILKEGPLVVAPSNRAINPCLACGRVPDPSLGISAVRRCTRCNWPVCSSECEKAPLHAENECQIFASTQVVAHQPIPGKLPEFLILALRVCLIKLRNPALYQRVFEVSSDFTPPDYEITDIQVQVVICLMILLADVKAFGFDNLEIKKLLQILPFSTYEVSTAAGHNRANWEPQTRSTIGLYLQCRMMKHSCIPNCRWEMIRQSSSAEVDFVRIITTTAVKKGDPLTHFSCPEHSEEPTMHRQLTLRKSGHFICKCARCLDSTELGTYVSGVVCKTCLGKKTLNGNLGYLLPQDPLDSSSQSTWKCNSCGQIKLNGDISTEMEQLAQTISNMEAKFASRPDDDSLIYFCQKFVNETSGITLHPNHWLIQKAMTVVEKYLQRHRQNTMSFDMSEYSVKCSKHLLSILDLLTPGLTINRAFMQRQLSNALHSQYHMLQTQGNYELAKTKYDESSMYEVEVDKYHKNGIPSD